ncbi:hypothetical protein C8Q76DRAFT_749000 [Earliella scabrosa]|nr:hypothetical protein C8Q76DRAFT_749000 [Earliella scabrosa]
MSANRVLLVLNTLHLSFTLASVFTNGVTSNLTVFTAPLTTIFIGRFLLHLQESAARTVRIPTGNSQDIDLAVDSRPSFVQSRILGSIAYRATDDEVEVDDIHSVSETHAISESPVAQSEVN